MDELPYNLTSLMLFHMRSNYFTFMERNLEQLINDYVSPK